MASGTIKAVAPISSTLRETAFTITTSQWTLSNGVYSCTKDWVYITEESRDGIIFDSTFRNVTADISTTKKTGGGGIVFTTASLPSGTISGKMYTIANEDGKTTILLEDAFIFKPITVSLDAVTNTSGSYSHTTTDTHVTNNAKPILIEYSNPYAFHAPVVVTTGDHEITLSCDNVVGSSNVSVTLVPTQSIEWAQTAPTDITSAEADILAERIDDLFVYSATEPSTPIEGMIWFKPAE